MIQWIAAAPDASSAEHKRVELFEILAQARACRLWMPANTTLGADSPWNREACLRHLHPSLHATPSLVIYGTAADARVVERAYGSTSSLRRLQLVASAHPASWGHGARNLPSIRLALGEALADSLQGAQLFREPVIALPLGIASERLPAPWPLPQRRGPLLLLSGRDPALGLAVQQQLEQQGQASLCELTAWPHQRWLEGLARAPAALVLAGSQPRPEFCQRRLSAMALDTLLVVDPEGSENSLCRDGSNALVRAGDAQELSHALLQLVDPGQRDLQHRLREGARRTLVMHRTALQQQRWLAILQEELGDLWRQVQEHVCEAEASPALRNG